MDTILLIPATCGLIAVYPMLYRGWREVRLTTLTAGWFWMFFAVLLWTAAWSLTVLTSLLQAGWADRLWYATAALMLCPFIAVLGARKPGSNAWTWFVLVPLLLVLGYPAFFPRGSVTFSTPLELEIPAVVGFGLVTIMGLGNYFGTRYSLAAGLAAGVLVLIAGSLTSSVSELFPDKADCRVWGTIVFSAAFLTATWQSRRSFPAANNFDRIWIDFRDAYGIVWAKRTMDRINRTAVEEQWPVRLELHGFCSLSNESLAEITPEMKDRIGKALRWQLSRFVEPDWIDRRLKSETTA